MELCSAVRYVYPDTPISQSGQGAGKIGEHLHLGIPLLW